MKRTLLLLTGLALVAAACGGGSSPVTTTTTTPPASTTTTTATPDVTRGNADGVLLQVSYEGGFAPLEFIVNRIPSFTLFTDGTLLYEGPVAAIFPGPAMPNVQQATLDEATMADILGLIDIVGLPGITEMRNNDAANFVADATDTVVRYFDSNGEHYFSVYALGLDISPDGSGTGTPDEVLNLGLLVDRLSQATSTAQSTPYQPSALQLVLLEDGFVDPQFENSIPWPFGDVTPAAFTGNDFAKCTSLNAGVGAVVSALAQANSVTTYELDGAQLRILVRPLLPGEQPCAMLGQ